VIDLYLRSSPGSPARQALWDYFDGSDEYKPKVAAQGGDGVLTRLSMLALFSVGLLGAILLLAWLAIRLFTQAATAFVLLLAAPFALFFPLLGDSGRRAFKSWGLTLSAALAKAIYAAFLSLVLLGIAILGRAGGEGGSATGFLLSAAFCWSVFLKRADLVGWLSIGHAGHGLGPSLATLMLPRRLSRTTVGASGGVVKALGHRNAQWLRASRAEQGEATRATARDSLHGRARALADSRHEEARRTVEEFERRYGRPRHMSAGSEDGERTRGKRDAESPSAPPRAAERARYERARELLGRAKRNESRGSSRWSERDLERFAATDRELLRSSRDPADHAHRIGLDRAQFEALRGSERERAAERTEEKKVHRAAVRPFKAYITWPMLYSHSARAPE